MRTCSNLYKLIALIVIISLPGCRRLLDRVFDPSNGTQTECEMVKLIRSVDDTATITYNDVGNPVTVRYSTQGYDHYWHTFNYDEQNRLVEYRVELEPGLDIEIHTYGYDDRNRVILDIGVFRLTGYIKIRSTFEYDSRNRIIKENKEVIDIEEGSQPFEIDPVVYDYDVRGNLRNPFAQPDSLVYDDKVNFRRTNKVWMLINRNYSLNNPVGKLQYNEYGLPVVFDIHEWFLGVAIFGIEYNCKN
jgi:hypothetical protein